MRIISDYHDYYDCMMKLDQDRSVIYHRNETYKDFSNLIKCSTKHDSYEQIPYDCGIIGFCGKLYKYFRCLNSLYNSVYYFNYDDSVIKRKSVNTYYKSQYKYFFDRNTEFNFNLFDIAPIWIINHNSYNTRHNITRVCFNPEKLANFEFNKVLKADKAYQELLMWHNNLAVPEKQIPKIDDKTMAEAKGFDKFSFRKGKHEKS